MYTFVGNKVTEECTAPSEVLVKVTFYSNYQSTLHKKGNKRALRWAQNQPVAFEIEKLMYIDYVIYSTTAFQLDCTILKNFCRICILFMINIGSLASSGWKLLA